MAQVAIVTTGHPQDIASSKDIGKGECVEVFIKTPHFEYASLSYSREPAGCDNPGVSPITFVGMSCVPCFQIL